MENQKLALSSNSTTVKVLNLLMLFFCLFKAQTTVALSHTTLACFNAGIYSGLIEGPDSSFYGTTASGPGPGDDGMVFRITRNGELSTLFIFKGTNGASPHAGLTLGTDGYLYGTTVEGGAANYGTAFRITVTGALITLADFDRPAGVFPEGELVEGANGYFYGATSQGGDNNFGTIFRISTNGALQTLFSFNGSNGSKPSALIFGADGNLYGTTYRGGAKDKGTAFRITTAGSLLTIRTFDGLSNGDGPSKLIQANNGVLYGTTAFGGFYNQGIFFGITTYGATRTLISLDAKTGSVPFRGVTQASDGKIYGTSLYGGAWGLGTIFQYNGSVILTNILSFDGINGSGPVELLEVASGDFYGTTYDGGINYGTTNLVGKDGTFFRLSGLVAPKLARIVLNDPILLQSGQFQFSFSSSNGANYTIQYGTTLSNWTSLETISGSGGYLTFTDSRSPDADHRFYRVVVSQ